MNSEVGGTAPAASRTSGLAIASFVLGLLSCMCLPAPVAIVLGIVALVQMGKDPSLKGKGFAIAGLVLPVLMVPVILAAIAVPNFIKFQSRSKQVECRVNLKSIATSQRYREGDGEGFTASFKELAWSPEKGNRYAYVMAHPPVAGESAIYGTHKDALREEQVNDAVQRRFAGDVKLGLDPESGVLTVVCAGNPDGDDGIDLWSVSSIDREAPTGGTIDAWTPFNDWNDLTEEPGTVDVAGGSGGKKRIDLDD